MPDTHDGKLESVRLNQEAARRLIQRATELDASLATESSVAELREAARGAGISDEAFQRRWMKCGALRRRSQFP